jgi:predicted 3-demethylubiquinone-9 3-methyltransferase (glyoxalase superfamily)
MPKVSPFLWFDGTAGEAASLYVSVLGGKILEERRWGAGAPAPEGSVMSVTFEIDGQQFTAFNGGPDHHFTDATSLWVNADTQEEIDRVWDALTADGGAGVACGWLVDKFGLSWQVVPPILGELLSDPDTEKSGRVMQAMLGMVKLDIAGLEAAAVGP